MSATLHKIEACRSGTYNGMDFDEEYTITFSYTRGSGDYWNGMGGHWEQGYPAEVEFISISPDAGDHGAFTDLAQAQLVQWARDWLDDNYDNCVDRAEIDSQPDPDYARDLRIEDDR